MRDPIRVALLVLLAVVLSFMVMPLLFVVASSFNPAALTSLGFLKGTGSEGLTLRWYEAALSYEPFAKGLANSVVVATIAATLATLAGSLAAVAFVRYRFRGREMLRSLAITPMVFPRVALGLGAYILFLRATEFLHIREAVIGTPLPLAIVHSVLGLPLVIVIVSATLVGVDPALEEAAMDLGATPAQTLARVTLPLVRVGLFTAAVFAFMFSFDEVETSIFISPVSGRTLPIEMFIFMEKDQSPTIAALSSLLMLGTLLVLALLGLIAGWRQLARLVAR